EDDCRLVGKRLVGRAYCHSGTEARGNTLYLDLALERIPETFRASGTHPIAHADWPIDKEGDFPDWHVRHRWSSALPDVLRRRTPLGPAAYHRSSSYSPLLDWTASRMRCQGPGAAREGFRRGQGTGCALYVTLATFPKRISAGIPRSSPRMHAFLHAILRRP